MALATLAIATSQPYYLWGFCHVRWKLLAPTGIFPCASLRVLFWSTRHFVRLRAPHVHPPICMRSRVCRGLLELAGACFSCNAVAGRWKVRGSSCSSHWPCPTKGRAVNTARTWRPGPAWRPEPPCLVAGLLGRTAWAAPPLSLSLNYST